MLTLSRQGQPVSEAILKASSPQQQTATARLRQRVLVENDLGRLTDLFAAALAEEGVAGHFAVEDGAEGMRPLFGDSPWLVGDSSVPAWEMPLRGALGERTTLLLAVPERLIDQGAMARIRGYAALYVGRARVLHEKASDIETACALTLCERLILGRMLLGEPLVDIAARIGRSVAAIASHVEDAVSKLGVADRQAAIALAARRGWLLTMVNEF